VYIPNQYQIRLIIFVFASGDDKERFTSEVHSKLQELERTKWLQVAKELAGEDSYQFLHAYSPGNISYTYF